MIQIQRERMIEWRRENNVKKIEYPTNLVSARRLGYKAKTGFILIRVRVPRGGKARPSIRHGRRSAHSGQRLVFAKGYQRVAEERANKQYPNLEVLNSYETGKDGQHYFFEIILVDPNRPEIKADKQLKFLSSRKNTKLKQAAERNSDDWIMSKTDFIPFISDYIRTNSKYSKNRQFLTKHNFDRYPKLKKVWTKLAGILDRDDKEMFAEIVRNEFLFDRACIRIEF